MSNQCTIKAVYAYGTLIMVECLGVVMRRNFVDEVILGENAESDGSATKMVTLSVNEEELQGALDEAITDTIANVARGAAGAAGLVATAARGAVATAADALKNKAQQAAASAQKQAASAVDGAQQTGRAAAAGGAVANAANKIIHASKLFQQVFANVDNFVHFANQVDQSSPMFPIIKVNFDKASQRLQSKGITLGADGVKFNVDNKWSVVATPISREAKHGLKAITVFGAKHGTSPTKP